MKKPSRPSEKSLRLCLEALDEPRSIREIAEALNTYKATARKMVQALIEDEKVAVAGEKLAANRLRERLYRRVDCAEWPAPPAQQDSVLPDPYMFRMVALRPGAIHA
jgi:hypothetical protein